MKQKFNEMYETLQSGNVKDFQIWLQGLTRIHLLEFACHCSTYDLLNIFEIERHFKA